MKANELMVGDWVKVTHLNKIGKAYRIDRANEDGNGWVAVFDGDYHESLLEPIPLTPEILEKNGWKLYDLEDIDWLIYDYSTNCQNVRISENDTYGYKWWIVVSNILGEDEAGFKDRNHAGIYCNYVHQLQHALRLCGIDKEIEI